MFLCVSVFNALVDLSRTPLFGGEEWGVFLPFTDAFQM